MIRNLLSLFILLSAHCYVQAQTINGKVIDPDGLPVIGAYIFHNSDGIHAHSNDLGNFICENSQVGDTLKFTYLGFETLEYVLNKSDFEKSEIIFRLEEKSFNLDQVVISNDVRSLNQISKIDLETNPVNSSQEVLRKVPGLFIGQHAGGGKAEQLFLRGFDIDHGTDVSITVDGLPVNMVSHAHGQGYADLHFLIPETIDNLDFGKGPYYANKGNFTTAGFVEFKTKEKLENSSFGLEVGQFNTLRTVGLVNLLNAPNQNAYVAAEYLLTDGPFDSPQNFNRINLMGKYTLNLPNDDKLSLLISHFNSTWDASGQIPQRAVDDGSIGRFGAIDDTEGGTTGRSNILISHTKTLSDKSFIKNRFFYSHYDFELFSNFTFFLEDPINGDQIKQRESRNIFGWESVFHKEIRMKGVDRVTMREGIGFRIDNNDEVELSHTLNRRETLDALSLGDIQESNLYAFADFEFDFGDFLINPGLRVDYFKFNYVNDLNPTYSNESNSKVFVAPNLNFIYNPNHHWQLFLKTGTGFHSNDARVVVAQNGKEILPAAYGADLGAIWKPVPRLWLNTALWYLFLEQEFVYVGDAGIVEPSGKTRRTGLEFGMRYQPIDWLFMNLDVNYTLARSIDEPEGQDYIPLAPDLTGLFGLNFRLPSGLTGGLNIRYIKDRPANEDNSIVAEGYTITDFNMNYSFKKLTFGLVVNNLFDVDWNETQFATESRLQGEDQSVEEIHFTPGTPLFVKGLVRYNF